MNSKISKRSGPYRLLLNITDKIKWKRGDKYVALSKLSIYYKSEISLPSWNEEFELPDGSYSVSDIQDYFEYILKNMEKRLTIFQ